MIVSDEILETVKTTLAVWGAGLSTYTAIRNRLTIDVAYRFVGSDDPDEVLVTNLSNKTYTLTSIELYTAWFRWFSRRYKETWYDDELLTIYLRPGEAYKFEFGDQYKITLDKNRHLYIVLHISGKGKITKRVC